MTVLKQQQCGIMNIYELVKDFEYMRFAEKYEVPMWIGEFVSQYNTGEEDIRRIMKSVAFDNCIINQEFVKILKNI